MNCETLIKKNNGQCGTAECESKASAQEKALHSGVQSRQEAVSSSHFDKSKPRLKPPKFIRLKSLR